jgi:hypothetical protein
MTAIPTGSWCLYYHNPVDTKWTPDSYKTIVSVRTWEEFFVVMEELGEISIQQGMLFWMREGVPPLYENHANIRGGCYSLRISRLKATYYFMIYTIAAMNGTVVDSSDNLIQGVSSSPKRIIEKNQSFNVIKIWNKDCVKFCKPDQLLRLDPAQQSGDILYSPHTTKKL